MQLLICVINTQHITIANKLFPFFRMQCEWWKWSSHPTQLELVLSCKLFIAKTATTKTLQYIAKKSFRVIRKTVNRNTFRIYSPRDLFISRNWLCRAWCSGRHKRSCCLANLWKVERIVLKAWIHITNGKSQAITSQKSLLRGHSHV